jgi:UDP-N-acetylglucosamine 2-epimerase (non-hydrolysing)
VLRLVGTDVRDILREGHELLSNPDHHRAMSVGSGVFGDGHAAEKIVEILEEKLAAGERVLPFQRGRGDLVLRE